MAPVDSRDHVIWYGGTRFLFLQHLSVARFTTPEPSLCQDLLLGRSSTVTKSSLGSISWAKVWISSHPVMCKTQMWPVNTPSKHKTLTQCWSNSGPPSAMLAQHNTSTGVTPCVCWAAGLAVQAGTTQCLLNVGPASPVLASIYSTVVSRPTSCWLYYRPDALNQAGLMLARRLWRWPTFSVASNTTRRPNTGLMLD